MPRPTRIDRPAPEEFVPYYSRYIDRVPGDDALPALAGQIGDTAALLRGVAEERALHRYAPGKWSVKEVIVHLADAERVFAYRALSFARAERNELPGMDENAWVPASESDGRDLADIVEEYRAVRAANVAMFRSFGREALVRRGIANGNPMSARAAAWVIAGHELHHRALLIERYGLGA